MVYQGTVQNGVVVLAAGVQLPEGSPVRVELVEKDGAGAETMLLSPDEYTLPNG